MEVRRLGTLALETFKTLNDLNPILTKNFFEKREPLKRRENNLEIPNRNTIKYGDMSISRRNLGPHIWNGLPEEKNKENSHDKLKKQLNTWYRPKYTSSFCSFTETNMYIENKHSL